jgi:phosphotriesterase-related protein
MGDNLVLEVIDILDNAGADLNRTVISHVDIWSFSLETCRTIASAGCYLEYDAFGYPEMLFPYDGHYIDWKSETQRVNDIIQFIDDGYLNQILMSHDVDSKYCLVSYGGFGYAHILRTIVAIMRDKGISNEQIQTILVENPKRILTFVSPKNIR